MLDSLDALLLAALAEDNGQEDITTVATVDATPSSARPSRRCRRPRTIVMGGAREAGARGAPAGVASGPEEGCAERRVESRSRGGPA